MDVGGTLLCCSLIGFIWGATNVSIKRSTTEITKVHGNNWLETFKYELQYLIFNWRSVLPFVINQFGSVLFYFVLLYSELSLVVPVTNSLTFLFTAIVSTFVGESVPSNRTIIGSAFVLLGITVCVIDKLHRQ